VLAIFKLNLPDVLSKQEELGWFSSYRQILDGCYNFIPNKFMALLAPVRILIWRFQ